MLAADVGRFQAAAPLAAGGIGMQGRPVSETLLAQLTALLGDPKLAQLSCGDASKPRCLACDLLCRQATPGVRLALESVAKSVRPELMLRGAAGRAGPLLKARDAAESRTASLLRGAVPKEKAGGLGCVVIGALGLTQRVAAGVCAGRGLRTPSAVGACSDRGASVKEAAEEEGRVCRSANDRYASAKQQRAHSSGCNAGTLSALRAGDASSHCAHAITQKARTTHSGQLVCRKGIPCHCWRLLQLE